MNRGLRKFFINRLVKNAKKTSDYSGWQHVKTVLILADIVEEKHRDKVESLQKLLISEGKSVQVLFHNPIKKPKENAHEDVYYKNSVNFFGKPKLEVFKIVSNSIDVLIDWSTQPKSPNDFIALQLGAKMKIGVNKTLPWFALTVSENSQKTNEINNEILKYLKLINK